MKLIYVLLGLLVIPISTVFAQSVSTPKNVQVTSYANSTETMNKYATLKWEAVPNAVKYNIYTLGSSEIFFDTTPTNTYTVKFNTSSSFYFLVRSVDSQGFESASSNSVTVQYPRDVPILPIPKNLRITQVEDIGIPDKRLVHLMWDPVPGAQSYHLYKNAGTSYWYDREVDTNLIELTLSTHSTYYYAISAKVEGFETARSAVITIDLKAQGYVDPTDIPVPTSIPNTQIPTIATQTEGSQLVQPTTFLFQQPTPTPTVSDRQINQLKSIEQDVKYLKDVTAQQEVRQNIQETRQNALEELVSQLRSFLSRIFGN